METETLTTYRIWEAGLKGSTYEDIKAKTLWEAKGIYSKKWGVSLSELGGEEVIPAN
jgi:hypothetical protein